MNWRCLFGSHASPVVEQTERGLRWRCPACLREIGTTQREQFRDLQPPRVIYEKPDGRERVDGGHPVRDPVIGVDQILAARREKYLRHLELRGLCVDEIRIETK